MLNLKNKLAKRILAFVLSGAMVVSGMTTSGITAFAAEPSAESISIEAPEDTNTYLEEEKAEEEQPGDGAAVDVNDDSVNEPEQKDTDNEPDDKNDSDQEAAADKESLNEEASKEEDKKDSESSTGDAEDEMTVSSDAEEEVQDTNIDNKTDGTHTVWMVGDSTVCSFTDGYYYPRYGYGTQLQNYLDESYTVKNIALSGRSSISYMVDKDDPNIESAEYKALKEGIKSGDVLIIGFGHNDEKQGEDDRFTDPTGNWQTAGSFAYSLYNNYVKIAENAGATAIVCTPIVRRSPTNTYTGSIVHITSDKTVNDKLYKGGSYPEAILKLAEDTGVKVVDLTTLTKEHWESVGNDGTLKLHAWTNHKETSVDNTHLNIYGAKVVAYMVATEIAKFSDLDIASHIVTDGKEPTEANDLKPNPDFQIPSGDGYEPPTGKSDNWENYGIFKGTVFGTVNKTVSDTQYHQLDTDANGNMHIAVLLDSTKVSADADGRAMYYYQIPATSTFTLSAKAKINAINAHNQVAFGLMARDDMFIDVRNEGILSDYVAAGTFGKGSTNCFKRKDTTLETGPKLEADVQAGQTYSMSIVKNPDGYACTFGDNATQSGGYDFQLTTVDDEYQYIGMFVSRNADITFSDIELIVDGYRIDIMTGERTPVDEGGENKPGGTDEGDENKPDGSDEGGENKPDGSDEGGENKPGGTDEGGENKPGGSDEGGESKPGNSEETDESVSLTPPEEKPEVEQSKIEVAKGGISLNESNKDITVSAANLIATKKQQWAVTVTYKYTTENGTKTVEQELTEGLHYTVNLVDGDGISGPQTISVVGTGTPTDLGQFTGSRTTDYELIDKKAEAAAKENNITKACKLSLNKDDVKNAVYTGTYITPAVEGLSALTEGTDYQLVYKNNVNVGKASVTVIGLGSYYGTKTLTFSIKAANISKSTLNFESTTFKVEKGAKDYTATLLDEKSDALTYKGKAITLDGLTVKLGSFTLPATDYTVTYKKNTQAGTATATIKALNNCTGSIKINYEIVNPAEITSDALASAAAEAELTAKEPAVTKITIGGVTLKAGVDFKADNKPLKGKTTVGEKVEGIKITGIGSYKKILDGTVTAEIVKGTFHIKDDAVVDVTKITGNDNKKLVAAAKVTDASGAKLKATDITITPVGNIGIKVTPAASISEKFKETVLACHVAKKLSSVKIPKGQAIEDKSLDGVNKVTLTTEEIAKILPDVGASDIRIVSYKNNHKAGTATVTIEARPSSAYYGTMNVKFKIKAVAKPKTLGSGSESGGTDESGKTDESDSDESGSNAGTDGSLPDESSQPDTDSSETDTSVPGGSEPDEPIVTKKLIDVWDFGGKQEDDTNTYKNNVTGADWDNCENLGSNGAFTASSTVSFGDLTINFNSNDRVYSEVTTKSYGTISGVNKFAYADGYTAAGSYYPGGTGGSSRRYLTINNVSAGDRIDVYAGMSNAGDIKSNNTLEKLYFEYLGTEGTQKETIEVTGEPTNLKLQFAALYSGTYKIWTDTAADLVDNKGQQSAGKPVYNRVKRIPAVDVKGTINFGPLTSYDDVSVKFVNTTTNAETVATLNGTSFSASLAAGYTYRPILVGATGFGFKNDTSSSIVLTDSDALSGKNVGTLEVETKQTYVYSGSITGFAADYDVTNLSVTMKADPASNRNDERLVIDENLAFTVTLEPDVTYTITLEGVNDYEVTSEKTINKNEAYTADIEVALKELFEVTGGFVDLDGNEVTGVTELTFKNDEDAYEYTAAVATDGASYSISLRDGAYSANAVIDGYSTSTHVVVDGADVQKNLLFVSTAAEGSLTRESDLYVDKNDSSKYQTVSAAVKDAKRMNPSSESERITIHIAPGTYREQITVDVPYITFVNDDPSKGEVLLTWYYGIGYAYYSVKGGYYDAERAYDKYEKANVSRWGCSVRVNASDFKAENIIFENSFNRYITQEEIDDGVELHTEGTDSKATFVRKLNSTDAEVASGAAVERAAAIALDNNSNNAEFKNCQFYSSQDTVYTTGNAYFKNCIIEGQTDYIFGKGNCIFDACELRWKGYSSGSKAGYVTAIKPDTGENGYLFRNCTITANDKLTVVGGYFGRPWGANAKVIFMNTKLEKESLIVAAGWGDMSGVQPEDVSFYEYKTTTTAGDTISTSGRKGIIMTDEEAAVVDIADYFGTWKPDWYQEEAETLAFTLEPEITSSGRLDTPKTGETLTVTYSLGDNDANDASAIKWYRVPESGSEVLVKTSTAAVSKTYKIQDSDEGSKIKVEVTPQTVSGKTGEAKTAVLGNSITKGTEEATAIKIFLAGDSTVKDYSPNGMYYSANAKPYDKDKGAWGEYLQSFFDENQVKIENYANGGRSSRSFINEGSLDKIEAEIGAGDYLFIQFGHNDCSDGDDYILERYVPLGTANEDGVYPVTAGTKVDTPEALKSKYGDTYYASTGDEAGTYKWFLKQYIEVAKAKDAIPVLVTSVSRMSYSSDGSIKPHHDASDTTDNAYVKAVKQLAEEENVLCIDAFELTKKMYEDAYTAGDKDTYGKQLMGYKEDGTTDGTHCNKLGGFIEACIIANAIKGLTVEGESIDIASALQTPKGVMGETVAGETVFTVTKNNGTFTAYDYLADPVYSAEAAYWTKFGQDLIDEITAE